MRTPVLQLLFVLQASDPATQKGAARSRSFAAFEGCFRVEVFHLDFGVRGVTLSALVPACFGEYEFVNPAVGSCTVVQLRWKKG